MPAEPDSATPRQRGHPYVLLATATLLWAGNFVLARGVHARVPPLGLAFWRWAGALLLLLPVTWRRLLAARPVLRRYWPMLIALGILGVGNFNTMVYVGLQETTATNAVLLNSACPAFILAITWALGHGRPAPRQLAGIAVSLLGVLVIVTRGDPAHLLRLRLVGGDLWVLAAVLSWAAYTALLPRRPPGVDPLTLLTALVVVGVAWIAPFYAWELARGGRMHLDAVTVGTVAYVAVLASVVAYVCFNVGVERLGARRAGPFLHLMPAFGSLMAVLLLGEAFGAYHAVGIGLVLAGVYLAGAAGGARNGTPSSESRKA